MIDRKASVFACDDLHQSLNGKLTISGMYAQDIVIAGEEVMAPQLIFFFMIEGPLADPFKNITLKVVLPGEAAQEQPISVGPMPPSVDPRRNRMLMKIPYLISRPILRPGKIETIVIHEKGELDAGGVWVVSPDVIAQT
jgi:hypothetical protein